jgi:hypothetical protein
MKFLRQTLVMVALAEGLAISLHAESVAPEPPLELPKLTVTDQRKLLSPESWRYAKVPGLEILSGAGDRETQKLLRDFQLFNEAIDVVWPALKRDRSVPLELILCGPGKFDRFASTEQNSLQEQISLFLRNAEHAAIVLDLGKTNVVVAPSEVDPMDEFDDNVPGGYAKIDHYAQLNHDYVRYLLSSQQPLFPAWLEEGLAQLLMSMRVENRFIEFAKIDDPNLAPIAAKEKTDALGLPITTVQLDSLAMQGRNSAIPLEEFFAVGHDSSITLNSFGTRWTRQAKGLLHMWLYGEGGRYNKGFARFVARAARVPVTETMFRECFGMGYTDMLMAYRIYTNDTAYKYQQFQAREGGGLPEPAPVVLREATPAEIGRIKGEALVLAGHPDAAWEEFFAPYFRGQSDAGLLASLGLFEYERGETARARKFLEAAAKQSVVRPRAYIELASLRFAATKTVSASTDPALLRADQTKSILQPLLIARQQPPPLPEVYELMADVWLHSSVAPAKADLAAINHGVLIFQRRPLHAAELNGKYGDPAEARTMAEFGIKLSRTPDARQAFEDVLAALPPVPAKK